MCLHFQCRTQDYPVDSEGYNQLTTVMKLFYAFAAIDSEELSRDSCLLREWLYFNGVLLNNGVIDYYTCVHLDLNFKCI